MVFVVLTIAVAAWLCATCISNFVVRLSVVVATVVAGFFAAAFVVLVVVPVTAVVKGT